MRLAEHIALAIIHAAAPRDDREWIVGDVLEDYDRVRSRDGAAAARRKLLDEAMRTSAHRVRTTIHGLHDLKPTGEGGMQTILNDVQYALRLLRRSPGFAATAMLTLALAIGSNTAIFSAVKGVLIAPLPYPEAERLVRLFEESPKLPHFPMAPADFRDYRAELQARRPSPAVSSASSESCRRASVMSEAATDRTGMANPWTCGRCWSCRGRRIRGIAFRTTTTSSVG
jgi:hypothetical protein